MPHRYEPHLKPYARALRSEMTLAERRLWHRLNRGQLRGGKFYRQKPIGPYIVDFYCAASNLVVEVDGGQHYTPEGRQVDKARDEFLAGLDLTVLRFSDRDVLTRIDDVVRSIFSHLRFPGE